MNWKKHRLMIGVVALVALIGASVWAANRREKRMAADVAGEAFEDRLPAIDKDEVDLLEIRRPDDDAPVKLQKKEGSAWRVVAPIEAEVDDNAIKTALEKLGDLEVTGVAATKKSNHEKLEVTDDKGVHVKVGRDGETVAELLVGAYRGGSTMVRAKGADEVLTVRGSIKYAFNKALKDWRNRTITDLTATDVKKISFKSVNGAFEFERAEDDKWTTVAAEPKIEDFDQAKVQSTVSSVARLRSVDFAEPSMTAEQAGLVGDDATTVTLVAEVEEEGDDAKEEPKEGKPETPKPKKVETVVLTVGKEIEGKSQFYLRRQGSDVIYVVSKYIAERMQASPDNFKKSEPAENAEGGEGAAPTPTAAGGKPDIPPETMAKIKAQLKQKGMDVNW